MPRITGYSHTQHRSHLNDIVPALTEDNELFKPYNARTLRNKFVVFLFECIPLDKVYIGLSQAWQPAPHRAVLTTILDDKRQRTSDQFLGSLVQDFKQFGPESFSCTVLSGVMSKQEARDTKHWLTSSIIPDELLYNKNKRGSETEWMF